MLYREACNQSHPRDGPNCLDGARWRRRLLGRTRNRNYRRSASLGCVQLNSIQYPIYMSDGTSTSSLQPLLYSRLLSSAAIEPSISCHCTQHYAHQPPPCTILVPSVVKLSSAAHLPINYSSRPQDIDYFSKFRHHRHNPRINLKHSSL